MDASQEQIALWLERSMAGEQELNFMSGASEPDMMAQQRVESPDPVQPDEAIPPVAQVDALADPSQGDSPYDPGTPREPDGPEAAFSEFIVPEITQVIQQSGEEQAERLTGHLSRLKTELDVSGNAAIERGFAEFKLRSLD